MSSKKVYLENLFEEIRNFAQDYETPTDEKDVVLLKPNEFRDFSSNLVNVLKKFSEKELFDSDSFTLDSSLESDTYDDNEFYEIDDDFDI